MFSQYFTVILSKCSLSKH